jgi:hypothetical protein
MTTKRKAPAKKSGKAAKRTTSRSKSAVAGRAAVAVATSSKKTVKQRVAAMAETSLAVCESDKDLQAMLDVLRDRNEPVPVRLAALQSLQAASFSVVAFESCRGDYFATLREVADDPDPEIRQRVLGILAREKDGYAQKKLIEGLEKPDEALVPPEKALQLLAYDVHAEAYAVARDIISNPPNEDARREALRLLAADATSAPVFEKLMRDKNELAEIRQLSASALQGLRPAKLQSVAREILLDVSDYDEIKTTSLTALTQFGDQESVSNDVELRNRVDEMTTTASPKVKQSARQFADKYNK